MIKITTDSTCDLPAQLLEQHHISVIPLGIVKGGELFRDGENITTADIAAHVDAGGDITTTNAVSIGDYEALFARESARNDAVIHLNIGIGFSCCHQNACLAAEEFDNVHVVDTANLSVGHGLLVLLAAEAAEAGASVEEILAMLAEKIPQVEMSFVLDRLDYMKKGGRCSAVLALGANLLKLHPCIEVQNGKMGVTKEVPRLHREGGGGLSAGPALRPDGHRSPPLHPGGYRLFRRSGGHRPEGAGGSGRL